MVIERQVKNFIDLYLDHINSGEINPIQMVRIHAFYSENFSAEKVLEYFDGWSMLYDHSKYRDGIILTNMHTVEDWSTTITINDGSEYMFADSDNWQYVPKTFSEFISDCLRYEDIDLVFSKRAIEIMTSK